MYYNTAQRKHRSKFSTATYYTLCVQPYDMSRLLFSIRLLYSSSLPTSDKQALNLIHKQGAYYQRKIIDRGLQASKRPERDWMVVDMYLIWCFYTILVLYTHTYIYTYIHAYIHTYIHTYTNTYTYKHTYIQTYLHTIHLHLHKHVVPTSHFLLGHVPSLLPRRQKQFNP